MPRVFLVILAATASLIAATQTGRAVRADRPLTLLTAWFFGCASALAAYVGLYSLMAYGSPHRGIQQRSSIRLVFPEPSCFCAVTPLPA
jgi:hypothetical protein